MTAKPATVTRHTFRCTFQVSPSRAATQRGLAQWAALPGDRAGAKLPEPPSLRPWAGVPLPGSSSL